jgi:hypothetical protein
MKYSPRRLVIVFVWLFDETRGLRLPFTRLFPIFVLLAIPFVSAKFTRSPGQIARFGKQSAGS